MADPGERRKRGCFVSLFMLPWLMFKLVFMILPKAFVSMPRAVARSVASQSTSAASGAVLPTGVGHLRPVQPEAGRAEALAAIKLHDPAFAGGALEERAASVRAVVEDSFVRTDAAAARLVMADGLWGTHRMLLQVREDNGITRGGEVAVVASEIVEAYHSTLIDEVRVRLTFDGACWDTHTETGFDLRGSRMPSRWHEDLTFTRSAQARTPDTGGVLARTCPNCGAGLAVTDEGACRTCHAVVMSGRQDWVLTGIGRDPW